MESRLLDRREPGNIPAGFRAKTRGGVQSTVLAIAATAHEHDRQKPADPTFHRRRVTAAFRYRREPVRRPRRRHQHHAPPDPGAGRGSDPPRPQPQRRGRRARRAAGRRRRHRAVSSYQGGHVEYFKYMVDMLQGTRRGTHPRVRRRRRHDHAGGNPRLEDLRRRAHLSSERRHAHGPDGDDRGRRPPRQRTSREDRAPAKDRARRRNLRRQDAHRRSKKARSTTTSSRACARNGSSPAARRRSSASPARAARANRPSSTSCCCAFCTRSPQMHIAVLAVDPTRRRSGGALLGDRIRMNSLRSKHVYMRSMATRRQHAATSIVLKDCIAFLKGQGYDLVIVETAGIGQSDSEIVDLVDFPMYVMTSDYGAASQLEKIDMLDFADLVVLNKFDKRGAEDALRDVRKQWKRNRVAFKLHRRRGAGVSDHRQPVQRSGRDLDVRQPVPPAAREEQGSGSISDADSAAVDAAKMNLTASFRALRLEPATRHHAQGAARDRADSRRARALSRRDRRAGPRHQLGDRASRPTPPTARRVASKRCANSATRTCRANSGFTKRTDLTGEGRPLTASRCANATTTP